MIFLGGLGPWKKKAEKLAEKIAIKYRREIHRQFSLNSPGKTKKTPKSALHYLGLKIPSELSFVMFDDFLV